jgi:hypothetical protein
MGLRTALDSQKIEFSGASSFIRTCINGLFKALGRRKFYDFCFEGLAYRCRDIDINNFKVFIAGLIKLDLADYVNKTDSIMCSFSWPYVIYQNDVDHLNVLYYTLAYKYAIHGQEYIEEIALEFTKNYRTLIELYENIQRLNIDASGELMLDLGDYLILRDNDILRRLINKLMSSTLSFVVYNKNNMQFSIRLPDGSFNEDILKDPENIYAIPFIYSEEFLNPDDCISNEDIIHYLNFINFGLRHWSESSASERQKIIRIMYNKHKLLSCVDFLGESIKSRLLSENIRKDLKRYVLITAESVISDVNVALGLTLSGGIRASNISLSLEELNVIEKLHESVMSANSNRALIKESCDMSFEIDKFRILIDEQIRVMRQFISRANSMRFYLEGQEERRLNYLGENSYR